MAEFRNRLWSIGRNCHGQDLIEYALLAALIAVGVGLIMPGAAESIGKIHSKLAEQASRVAAF